MMKFIGDIFQQSWEYDQGSDSGKQIYVGFRDNGKVAVTFDSLRFGITISLNGEQIMEANFPETHNEYVFSDQDFLAWFDASLIRLGVEYQLTAWAENSGHIWEDSFTVLLPRHPQTYLSWFWHDEFECWVPPAPYPQNENHYEWDEEMLNWKLLTA